MNIRSATVDDWPQIWEIFQAVVSAGDTYAYDVDTDERTAKKLWIEQPRATYVAQDKGCIVGTYFIKTNQAGPGSHVCNCGYMVRAASRGRGTATAMLLHSQEAALAFGYQAMQFNFVVSSNSGAIRLWLKHGFESVGRIPNAFKHPEHGLTDALVMFKWLAESES